VLAGGSGPKEGQGGAAQRPGDAGHFGVVDGEYLDSVCGELRGDAIAAVGGHNDAGR
jgi:hypothetical protein